MAGVVGVAVLVMRIAWSYPVAMPMRRVAVIAADPGVLIISPFIVAWNPNGGMVGPLPLLIVLLRRRWALRTDVDTERRIC